MSVVAFGFDVVPVADLQNNVVGVFEYGKDFVRGAPPERYVAMPRSVNDAVEG